MSMNSELTLEVVYYNEQLAVCEPLIEPVEVDSKHRPWMIGFQVSFIVVIFIFIFWGRSNMMWQLVGRQTGVFLVTYSTPAWSLLHKTLVKVFHAL